MWVLLARILGLWAAARFLRRGRGLSKSVDETIAGLSVQDKGRLLRRLAGDATLPLYARAVAFLPGVYVLSPIDLVPDFIPIVGKLDDEVIFGVALTLLSYVTPRQAIEGHLDAVRAERTRRSRAPK